MTDGDMEPVAVNLRDINDTTRETLGETRLLLFRDAAAAS